MGDVVPTVIQIKDDLVIILFAGNFITYPDGDISHPQVNERSWELNPFNFDDVMNGLLTLFTVATFEGEFFHG